MASLTEAIEQHLLELLRQRGRVELQRGELAERFGCAPSQINYVLLTRFTTERGFLIESRRGGGGYIRLVRLPTDAALLPERLSQEEAGGWVDRLELTDRERAILKAVLDRRTLDLPLPLRDEVRARIMRAVLGVLS